ncbi:transposase [Streptomyces sp. R-74717]|uniref:IS110 family transposase n=1 Tax=Streptomyces sp. R-74717 TaxID=2969820 RepID=UPI0039B59A5D
MSQPIEVIGGIDTHTDLHQAAVIDTIGRHLATEAFPTTPTGYRDLPEWLHSHGQLLVVGMEGTGSFGAELSRYLHTNQITVIEVDRPDRRARRAAGKSDPIDAYAAATAVLAGRATGTPKHRDGAVEAIRGLRVVRASAVKARTQTINQIKSLIITAPAAVREALRSLTTTELVRRLAASRPGTDLAAPATAVKLALKRLAKRYRHLSEESRVAFSPQDQGRIYHATLMAGLDSAGALRRCIPGGLHGLTARQVDRIQRGFAECPADRQRFADLAAHHLPSQVPLFRRWAAMHYYTIPLLFDPPGRIREVPKSAALLADSAGPAATRRQSTGARTVTGLDDSAPIDPVLRQLLFVPTLTESAGPDAVGQVVDALLGVRERHEGARRVFHGLAEDTFSSAAELRNAFSRELARQRRISARAGRRARMMPWIGVGIGLGSTVAGLGMSPELSTALGAATTLVPTAIDLAIGRRQDNRRPWVLAHEDVTRTLSAKEIAGGT